MERCTSARAAVAHGITSFQIGADDLKQLLDRIGIQRLRIGFCINEMQADMVFHDFRHKTCHGAARAGDEMQNLLATSVAIERPFDGVYLTFDATNARQ